MEGEHHSVPSTIILSICSCLILRIRLYSTKSFKPLGTLKYHKSACQCLEFARSIQVGENPDVEEVDSDDEELSKEEKINRSRWLVAGGKDNRVSIWPLMNFEKQA